MTDESHIWKCEVINAGKDDRLITWILLNGVLVFVFTLVVVMFIVGFLMKWNFFESPLSGQLFLCLSISFLVLSIYAVLVLFRINKCRRERDNELYMREHSYTKYE